MKANKGYQTLADMILAKEAFTKGLSEGYKNFNRGFTQSEYEINESRGLEPKGTAQEYTRQQDLERQNFANQPLNEYSPLSSQVGQFVGELAPWIADPSKGVLANTLSGTAQAGTAYVPEGESRAQNAALGLGGSAILGTGMKIAGKVGGKIYNAVKGNYSDPNAAQLIEQANREQIPLYYQDIVKDPKTAAKAKELEESGRMISANDLQNQAVGAAAKRRTNRLSQELQATEYDAKPILQEIARSGGVRAEAAQKILREYQQTGNDWQYILNASGNGKLLNKQINADVLYKKVAMLADAAGNIDTKPIQREINGIIKKQRKAIDKDTSLIGLLEGFGESTTKKIDAKAPSKILDPQGRPAIPGEPEKFVPREMNYSDLKEFSSDLGSRINDYYNKSGDKLIGEKGVRALKQLKVTVDNTLQNFTQKSNNPELAKASLAADKYYKHEVIPYKDKAIAKAFGADTHPDEIYAQFIKRNELVGGKGTGRAQKFYDALDSKGQAAVRYGMVSDAYAKALKKSPGKFDNKIFSNELRKITGPRDVFFDKTANQELNGFLNLVDMTQNSAKAPKIVKEGWLPTNKVAAGAAIIGGILGQGWGGAVGGYATALAGKTIHRAVKNAQLNIRQKLFTTEKGRNFLLASSKISPNSENALQRVTKLASKYGIEDMMHKEMLAERVHRQPESKTDFSKMSDEEFNAAYSARKRTAPDFSKMSDEEFNAAYEKRKGNPYTVDDYLKERNQAQ